MQAADTIQTETDLLAYAANENARRRRAHGRARRHSARVRMLRRLIPVAAGLAVMGLAAVVLWGPLSGSVPNVSIGPISVSGTKVTMENPRLSGFRKGERGYEVVADAAQQDVRKPSIIELQAMTGHVATDDKGGRAYLQAQGGVFDSTREMLNLENDIRLWTDKGEEVRLSVAAVDFKAGSLRSSKTVTVTVPAGSIVADTLDVVENGRVVSFVGGVHAVFHGEEAGTKDGAKVAPGTDAKPESERIHTSAAEPPERAR
ncbi:lipopolysaccharide-assembly, LptC-related protein [Methylorubrum zatmanii]|uniref:Lipopolysaccharide-assembly, LptC-related protein n=1 Tax=Methylorubrum zatmanii TaxID=29429 RepID=A0ABW1WVK1_9HYPH|nr:lipopolysaccharide-assembly, LptC-related protein [Methylorubrum zatmanii]MBD8905309.1 lipopolysaccharide-assembly, LptC-related protein [Methylorubrum zatmanii]